MQNETALIKQLYEDFNARKIDAILAVMSEDVMWANGMNGGYVHGHKDLRNYWERQWSALKPHIKPVGFKRTEEGSIWVDALFSGECMDGQQQEFKDMPVVHIFHVKDRLVSRFDIQGRS